MTDTADKFHACNKRVRLLMGPVGCGKSVADCLEVVKRAHEQEAGDDGIRRSRWAIIRNTYPELKATTIKTWQDWFPAHIFGPIKFDSPISHRIALGDVDLEVIFLALDSVADIKKLMSFELTGIYINELQFIPKAIFDICLQRINRYPAKKSGAKITWTGVIADTNPPSTRHWIYKLFEQNKPDNYELFKYEPALLKVNQIPSDQDYAISLDGTIYVNNLNADYLEVQNDFNYWLNLVPGYTDEQIKVYLQGEYGIVIDGRPIHPEYKDRLHYANKALVCDPRLEIGLGWDFGLTPACAIVQFTARGQLVVIGELYSDEMGLHGFAENIVIPFLNRLNPDWRNNYISRHDPAGQSGSQTDMRNCQDVLRELGISSVPAADTNAPTPRREGLKYHLKRLVDGEPGFLLSSNCPQLREGLMGHFQYARIQSGAETTRYQEKPLKNEYSHVCEALEYIAMYYARPMIKKDHTPPKLYQQYAQQSNRLNQARQKAWYK